MRKYTIRNEQSDKAQKDVTARDEAHARRILAQRGLRIVFVDNHPERDTILHVVDKS
jgi:hypothetical protein